MKLLRLYVDGYKNLNDIEFDFSKSNGCALVVGTNGSGKSNLLEVLSAIFSALYNNQKKVEPDFSFTIEYIIERMRTGGFGGGPWHDFPITVKVSNDNNDKNIEILCKTQGMKDWGTIEESQSYITLPEHVVAVYSGEEKRLWEEYYFKFYDDYNKQYTTGKYSYKTQNMLYINKYYWNLVVGALSIYDDDAVKQYLTDSGLIISKIKCKFDIQNIKKNHNPMAKEILDNLNPDLREEAEFSVEQIAKLQDICGYEQDVFYNLLVLVLYKQFKIITDFKVIFKDGKTIRELSEGEKKLILIYGVTRIIEGECLFLLDEPDAHIHEGRKKEIYDLIKNAADENQFVVTSHSPTMTNHFDINELFVLTKNGGKVSLLEEGKKQAIARLTNGEWSYIDQTVFFDNKKPLVIVEGKSDIDLIRQAVKEFSKQKEYERYTKIDYEFLAAGGTGNISDFYEKIKDINADKKIIILCDNDKPGNDTIKKFDNTAETVIARVGYKIIDKIVLTKLPKTEHVSGAFVIEDYLPKSVLDNAAKRLLANEQYKSFSSFPTIKQDIKKEIGDKAKTYSYEELKNMKVLLDLLYNIGIELGYIVK